MDAPTDAAAGPAPRGTAEPTGLRLFADAIAAADAAPRVSPNPAVGAALYPAQGEPGVDKPCATGHTQPPGGAHAEIVALDQARQRGWDPAGMRMVVTLEPCNHTGRTGPCAEALIAAGIKRVDYLLADPFAPASGGAETLRAAGVEVHGPYLDLDALAPWTPLTRVEQWVRAQLQQRCHVTWKTASTLDGLSAAADGSSQWITGDTARAQVHEDRLRHDAIIIGTGTVYADDPQLTARIPGRDIPPEQQPWRVIVGERPLPPDARITRAPGVTLHYRTRDLGAVLSDLWQRGAVDVLLEGGAHLAGHAFDAGLIDAVQAYLAPALLGGGLPSLRRSTPDPAATTMGDIARFLPRRLDVLGSDCCWLLSAPTVHRAPSVGQPATHDPEDPQALGSPIAKGSIDVYRNH